MAIISNVQLFTPFEEGSEITLTQGPGGQVSHSDELYYGWDFVTQGEPTFGQDVLAVASGRIVYIEESVPDGGPVSGSFGDGTTPRDPSLGPLGALGNVVTIEHNIGENTFYSSYFHLMQDSAPLNVGDFVLRGSVIGQVGNTGVRDGTHLHVNIGETIGSYTNSVGEFSHYQIAEGPDDGGTLLRRLDFLDAPSGQGGRLDVGDVFTSTTAVTDSFVVNSQRNGSQYDPEIAVLEGGGFVVAFVDQDRDPDREYDNGRITYRIFDDSGRALTGDLVVQTEYSGAPGRSYFNAQVATLADGTFIVSWYEAEQSSAGNTQIWTNSIEVKAQLFDRSGSALSDSFLVDQSDSSPDGLWISVSGGEITPLENGDFVQVFRDQGGDQVIARIFNPEGTRVSDRVVIFENDPLFDSPQTTIFSPVVTALNDGGFLVAGTIFQNSGSTGASDIFLQTFTADGVATGSFVIESDSIAPTTIFVETTGGNVAVSWSEYDASGASNVSFQLFDIAGNQVTEQLKLVDTSLMADANSMFVDSPQVLSLSDGTILITWQQETFEPEYEISVHGQRIDANGNILDIPFVISEVNGTYNYDIAELQDGNLLLSHGSGDPSLDGDGSAIIAKIFEAGDADNTLREAPSIVGLENISVEVGEYHYFAGNFLITDDQGDDYFIEFADDTPGSDGGLFAEVPPTDGSFIPIPRVLNRDGSGDLNFIGFDAENGNYRVYPFQPYDVAYIASQPGTNVIELTATDEFGNVSDPFLVTITAVGDPTNEAPNLNIAEPFSQAFAIPENTTFIIGLNPSDDIDSEGNGLTYSVTGSSADLIDVDQVDGSVSFINAPDFENPFDSQTTSGSGASIGYEFTVTVTDSGGLTDSADFFVRVTDIDDNPEPLARADTLELEYFARQSAYASGPLGEIGGIPSGPYSDFLTGWETTGVFEGGRYRAVVLEKDGYEPVLAIRGTAFPMDWIENFDLLGVGFSEATDLFLAEATFTDGMTSSLGEWLFQNSNASITGHSQGGAIAMTISSLATDSATVLTGDIATFNSPGVSDSVLEGRNFAFENVTHFVSNGDIVSLVGGDYIQGDVYFYDVDVPNYPANPVTFITGSHTQHWAQPGLVDVFSGSSFSSEYEENAPFDGYNLDSATPLLSVSTTEQLASPFFSYRTQHPGEDGEFAFFDGYASVFSAGAFGVALTNRATLETSRVAVSLFLEAVQASGTVITGLGNFILDSTEGALLQTWSSANDLGSWIGDRFAFSPNLLIAEGSHTGTTAAIVLDVGSSNQEVLGSTAGDSVFLLTDPDTQINFDGGGNLIWGTQLDFEGATVSGGVIPTDEFFIQDTSFETADLQVDQGSAIIAVDTDQDGEVDFTITWDGDYLLENIIAEQGVDGTYIRYLGNNPTLGDDERNVLTGDGDDDQLYGRGGADTLNGSAGDDMLFGGEGSDALVDAFGTDRLDGGEEDDLVAAFSGENTLLGDAGNDLLTGGIGSDRIAGGEGNDVLIGDISNFLFGNDRLAGGTGDDLLQGGLGADVFVFARHGGTDTIAQLDIDYDMLSNTAAIGADFQVGIDGVDVSSFGYASAEEAYSQVSDIDGHATFADQGTTIVFFDIQTDQLSADNFLFV